MRRPAWSKTSEARRRETSLAGTTWFFLENVNPVPGPTKRRIAGRKPPLSAAEEWELLEKLMADSEFQREALVGPLFLAGIERRQRVAVWRASPDL